MTFIKISKSKQINNFFLDNNTFFCRAPDNLSEVLIRTHNDKWIVGRKSDQREFFVVFDYKNSLLIEINGNSFLLTFLYINKIKCRRSKETE